MTDELGEDSFKAWYRVKKQQGMWLGVSRMPNPDFASARAGWSGISGVPASARSEFSAISSSSDWTRTISVGGTIGGGWKQQTFTVTNVQPILLPQTQFASDARLSVLLDSMNQLGAIVQRLVVEQQQLIGEVYKLRDEIAVLKVGGRNVPSLPAPEALREPRRYFEGSGSEPARRSYPGADLSQGSEPGPEQAAAAEAAARAAARMKVTLEGQTFSYALYTESTEPAFVGEDAAPVLRPNPMEGVIQNKTIGRLVDNFAEEADAADELSPLKAPLPDYRAERDPRDDPVGIGRRGPLVRSGEVIDGIGALGNLVVRTPGDDIRKIPKWEWRLALKEGWLLKAEGERFIGYERARDKDRIALIAEDQQGNKRLVDAGNWDAQQRLQAQVSANGI